MSALVLAAVTVVVAALLGTGAARARRRWVVVRVVGGSMAPTFRDGELVIARRVRGGPLRRGDVVVFAPPPAPIAFAEGEQDPALRVKRVAALPGDAIPRWAAAARAEAGDGPVPPGRLVVEGDAAESQDSRHYGLVALADVFGIVRRGARGPA
jgi:signal peptidase I